MQCEGFEPRISLVEPLYYANHYTIEPTVIAIIFKWTLVYVSLLLCNLFNSVNSLTVKGKWQNTIESGFIQCGIFVVIRSDNVDVRLFVLIGRWRVLSHASLPFFRNKTHRLTNLDNLLIRQKMIWDLKTKHIFPELVNVWTS